jgi:hypothetical protein
MNFGTIKQNDITSKEREKKQFIFSVSNHNNILWTIWIYSQQQQNQRRQQQKVKSKNINEKTFSAEFP